MKAAITDGRGRLWIEDVPVPEPGDHECLCRIDACATCTGTDQKHIAGKLPFECPYPGILGHESVGTVQSVGRKVRYVKPGDRVLRPCAALPGEMLGGFHSDWGGFAEYGLAVDRQAWMEDRPDDEPNNFSRFQQVISGDLDISAADATMLITLKEAASFMANAEVGLFRSVAVLGAGSVGISMTRFACIFGAVPVIVVARRDAQLEYARQTIGADVVINSECEDVAERIREATGGRGVDRIIDTTGSIELLCATLGALAPDGKAAPYATYAAMDTATQSIPADKLLEAVPCEDGAHAYLSRAVRQGLVTLGDFYSHRMPLDRIVEGFEMLKTKEAFKIVFEMEGQ